MYRAKKFVTRLEYDHFVQFDKHVDEMTLEELFFDNSQPFHLKILEAIPENGKLQIGPNDAKNTIIESYKSENVLDGKVLYSDNDRLDSNNILKFY